MTTTWKVLIDWDRDGNFTGTHDDVTAYVITANWFLGMRRPYQNDADNSMLDLMLNNADKRFSPENGSGPLSSKLVPLNAVKITSDDGTTERTMLDRLDREYSTRCQSIWATPHPDHRCRADDVLPGHGNRHRLTGKQAYR